MTPMPDRDHDSDLDDAMTPTVPAELDTPQHTTLVQLLPPVTSMPTPPIDRQLCALGFKLGEVLEDEYTNHPTTTILIDASQEDGAKILTTPRQQLVPSTTPPTHTNPPVHRQDSTWEHPTEDAHDRHPPLERSPLFVPESAASTARGRAGKSASQTWAMGSNSLGIG